MKMSSSIIKNPKEKKIMPWNIKVGDEIGAFARKRIVTGIRKYIGAHTGSPIWEFTLQDYPGLNNNIHFHGKFNHLPVEKVTRYK